MHIIIIIKEKKTHKFNPIKKKKLNKCGIVFVEPSTFGTFISRILYFKTL